MIEDTIEYRMKELTRKHRELTRSSVKPIWNNFEQVIAKYLSGNHSTAFEMFYEIFVENIDNMRISCIKKDTCFYRMRVGKDGYDEFSSDEMFHIPFQLNYLVGNERYSISGFPSLYFGSSVYGCYEELRRPNIDYTNVALFKATEDICVFDLSNQERYHFTKAKFMDCLVYACSIQVQHPDAPFKPEYIIPQLVMQSIVKYNNDEKHSKRIIGIKYSSTHVKDHQLWKSYPENRKNKKLFYNYAFPVLDREEFGASKQLKSIFQFWNSMTFNKMKLMHPNYQPSNKQHSGCSAFENMEYILQDLPMAGMLTYDSSSLKGALTI